jgi:hypothetical protein
MWKGAKALDTKAIAAIEQGDKTIQFLSAKPQRTAARESYYRTVKTALEKLGPSGVIALQHLVKLGRPLDLEYHDPPLPPHMTRVEYESILNRAVGEQIVFKCQIPVQGGVGLRYEIPNGMISVLEEALYESET